MKKISISKYILISALIACGVSACMVWYMVVSISEMEHEISVLIGKVEEAEAKEGRLQSARASIEDTQSQRAELDAYFVSDANVPDFFAFLEELGATTGVTTEISNVSVVQNDTKESVSSLERIKFDLDIEGSFGGVAHTIALIEAMPYDVLIDQVALGERGEGWEARLVGSVTKHK